MTPINPRNNPSDFGFSNSELSGKFSVRRSAGSVKASNFFHSRFAQLCHRTFLALRISAMTLLSHVSKIISLTSKKKMIWIHADLVIATVTNASAVKSFTFWNRSKMNFPRNAVRNIVAGFCEKLTVTVKGCAGSPKPAAFRFIHLCPKSFQNIFGQVDGSGIFNDSIGSIIHNRIVNFVSGFAVLITSPNRAQFLTREGVCQ